MNEYRFTDTDDPALVDDLLSRHSASAVVAVPIFNGFADVEPCLESIWQYTPASVPILLIDDASTDTKGLAGLAQLCCDSAPDDHCTILLRKAQNCGFVHSANLAAKLTRPSDLVLVNSDVRVAAEWFTRLAAASGVRTTVASVSCLTNHGSILSVPQRNHPTAQLPRGMDVNCAAALVAKGSPRLRPSLPTAVGHCTYFRRLALDAVGSFSTDFSPGYGEEVDWSQRAIAMGFEHVLADDVFVYHRGYGSFGSDPANLKRQRINDAVVALKHPYYLATVRAAATSDDSTLAASLLAARCSLLGVSLAIDGMCLGRGITGTQRVVLGLTRALAEDGRVRRIDLLVPKAIPTEVREAIAQLPKVTAVPTTVGRAQAKPRSDVVVRPYQFTSIGEIQWLRHWAPRMVVLQLDFIAYDNPGYFVNYREWRKYRATQELALATADGVGFISAAVRSRALLSHILPTSVASSVVYPGVGDGSALEDQPLPPLVARPGLERGFLLQLGVAFAHKNRLFALQLADQMRKMGWDGMLVLAGPEPSTGSSVAQEREWLSSHPETAARTLVMGAVSEEEKDWLYANAGLVLYPTVVEGFGLVPFEAAQMHTPCLSTRQGSLDEVLPQGLMTLSTLDPVREAATAMRILSDPTVAAEIVNSLRRRGAEFTWVAAGQSLMALILTVIGRPRNPTVAVRAGTDSVTLAGIVSSRWSRRLLDPLADRARTSGAIQSQLLPPSTVRGQLARRVYHRLTRDL